MKALAFELNGKMAHFRKYYSNSTALSYMVPPVATIKGILAGLLGYERDTYYEKFSNVHCKIAIFVKRPIKKITQTMNLLKIENLNDLCGAGRNRTQNHTEFIVPKDIRHDWISYHVIVCHDDEDIVNELERSLCRMNPAYSSKGISLALGSAQCPGWVENGRIADIQMLYSDEKPVAVSSAVVLEKIDKICIDNTPMNLFKEENITEFDKNRMITLNSKKDVLVGLNGYPLQLLLKPNTEYFDFQGKYMMFVE
jgi:CRISPR-associated protein Cas5h